MYIIFAGCIKYFLQNVLLLLSYVRHTRTHKDKKTSRILCGLFFCLFDKRNDKCGKKFCGFYGFLFFNKSGKTFAISHFFVFCPNRRRRHSVFELAAIIIKRNVSVHRIQVLSYFFRAQVLACCQLFICELSVHRVHYTHPILQNQVVTIMKTAEIQHRILYNLNKNENAYHFYKMYIHYCP